MPLSEKSLIGIRRQWHEQERTNSGNGRKIKMITIRRAQATDLGSIQKVIETAFSDEENKVIMHLAQELSKETTSPSIKSLIDEVDNQREEHNDTKMFQVEIFNR